MKKTLHILNKKNTLSHINGLETNDDVVVWREILCEGDVCEDVGSDLFWKKRYAFFEKEYQIDKLTYYDKTIKEILKTEDVENYKSIVLWFECDLFSQINMLALCVLLLKQYRKDISYYIVTIEKNGKTRDFLNENTRVKLSRYDLLYAQQCWNEFVKKEAESMRKFDFGAKAKFKCLQQAINQYLKNTTNKNGLNQIESKIVALTAHNISAEEDLVKELLLWQQQETIYGFIDMQYTRYIKRIKMLLEQKGAFK